MTSAARAADDAPPDFSPLANADMQAVLHGRWMECFRCVYASAPMAATVMMGGLLETPLLARINLEANKTPVSTALSAPGRHHELKRAWMAERLDQTREPDVGGIEEVAGDECAFASAREGLTGPRSIVVAV